MRNLFHTDRRRQLANFIESLLEEAAVPVPPSMRRFMRIYRRPVVLACTVPLGDIAAVLRDAERPVSESAVRELATFLQRADRSALYGESPLESRRVADLLAAVIAGDMRMVTAA